MLSKSIFQLCVIVVVTAAISNELLTISLIKKNVRELGAELIHMRKNLSEILISYTNTLSAAGTNGSKNDTECPRSKIESVINSTAKLLNKLVDGEIMQLIQTELTLGQMEDEELAQVLGSLATNGTNREQLLSEISRFRNLAMENIKSVEDDVKKCAKHAAQKEKWY
ncbi:Hypothetical protein NTJ_06368 [Nesidiocoris tenuis]|uniref:Uncharacterized protein n=1 Tax=Nesidiocoris tenuis TaxID=355587 RepID=A0ABN7AQ41_9HEMI|nr:Hypothetical protein NTJ_06368 [Nesidiocoris tenuis]